MEKKTLGNMIADLRREKGMTQLELAEKMGITDKAVSKWERDLSYPDISSLAHLAEILGVSVNELMQSKRDESLKKEKDDIVGLILRAVAVAMGIAVAVLSALDEIDGRTGMLMLSIGLASLAIQSLNGRKKE